MKRDTKVKDEKDVKKESKKKMPKSIKIIGFVLVGILGIIVLMVGIVNIYYYSRINYQKLDKKDLAINENTESTLGNDRIINIAIFGLDSRQNNWYGLSDSIMVISLDYIHGSIKISSFMRDSLVYIQGHGYEKQTHAYSYGGAQLAVKTLNENYDLDIEEYVTVNFIGLETIINKLGGLTLDIRSNEINEINKYIKNLNKINGGEEGSLLTKDGNQKLSGRQVVAFSRIRKVGDGDAQRTDRQREVIEEIIDVLSSKTPTQLTAFTHEFMPWVQTSFSLNEIVGKITDYDTFKHAKVYEFRYPANYVTGMVNGASVVRPITLEENVIELHKFIYEVEDYIPSARVKEISKVIQSK